MLHVIKCQGSTDAIRRLWRLTYEGRRKEIDNGKYASIYELMKNHCPLLNQVDYVRDRFYLNDQYSILFKNFYSCKMNLSFSWGKTFVGSS